MPYSRTNDCRFYKLIGYKIKFMVSPKIYRHSKVLNPYQEIKNGFLYSKPPKEGKSHYIAFLKIRGLDLSTLNDQEARIKLEQFHIFLINLKKHFSIAKINQKYAFTNQLKNLKQTIQTTKQLYDEAQISEQDYRTRIEQLNNQINIINNIDIDLKTNPFQQNFYLMLYNLSYEELNRSIHNVINDLESIGLFVEQLTSEEEINVIKNIFNPMNDDISKETIDQNRLDLDNILSFNRVEFKKDHILINEQLYLSFFGISDYPTEIDNY